MSPATTHVPLEDLAAHAAGDLSSAAANAVLRHAGRCPACQADLAALRRTDEALALLPESAIPLRVAIRISDALHREAPVAPPVPQAVPVPPPVPQPVADEFAAAGETPAVEPRTDTPTFMAPVVALPSPPAPPAPDARPLTATGPAFEVPEIMELSAGADLAELPRRKSRLPAIAGIAASLVLAAVGAVLVTDQLSDDSPTTAAAPVRITKFESSAVYNTTNTPAYATLLLDNQQPPAGELSTAKDGNFASGATDSAAPETQSLAVGPGIERLRDPATLQDCLTKLKPGAKPLALDYASFDGLQSGPALIILFPEGKSIVEVYVVGPRCGKELDDLYHFARFERPA